MNAHLNSLVIGADKRNRQNVTTGSRRPDEQVRAVSGRGGGPEGTHIMGHAQSGRGAGSVVVSWAATAGADREIQMEIPVGRRLDFGISPRSRSLKRNANKGIGRISVRDDFWTMSNYTPSTPFVVENLEGGTELIKVAPRRLDMVVPFELSRVLIPAAFGLLELKVFANEPRLLDQSHVGAPPDFDRPLIDTNTKHFLVLVALCEPRLRVSPMAAIPSVQEVAERLRPAEGFRKANRGSINYHIDYLLTHKLLVSEWASSCGGRMHSKREALVFCALRYDLVREEHLNLLPPLACR
ncbi:hypothetical protein [Nonomuraea sp. NPDC049400]|uniref:hypothetical protein n=1 Tax=Nonomuraea sp. NPDC049400 TaxID=3364352 RepID=UPI0037B80BF7